MAHNRAVIRAAIATALAVPGATAAGTDKVFRSQINPADGDQLPCVIVYTTDESSRRSALSKITDRSLTVKIEGYVAADGVLPEVTTRLDDTLDELARQIEVAMEDWIHPGPFGASNSLIVDGQLVGTAVGLRGAGAEAQIGMVQLTYRIDYRTQTGDPAVVK